MATESGDKGVSRVVKFGNGAGGGDAGFGGGELGPVGVSGGGTQMLKAARANTSRSWAVSKTHRAAYTGGHVDLVPLPSRQRVAGAAGGADEGLDSAAASDGHALAACTCGERVALLDLATGEVVGTLQEKLAEEAQEPVTAFVVHPSRREIVVANRSGMIRHWDVDERRVLNEWKGTHKTPVLCMAYDPTGTLVATGGSDRVVMVWDVERGYATHHFRGHEAIVTHLRFHPDPKKLMLASCSEDTTVRLWALNESGKKQAVAALTNHYSPVTGVAFSADGNTLVTGGRDKVLNIWDLAAFKLRRTIPVYETLEGLVSLPREAAAALCKAHGVSAVTASGLVVVTCGDKGTIRAWRIAVKPGAAVTCECLASQKQRAGESASSSEEVPVGEQYAGVLVRSGKRHGASVVAAGESDKAAVHTGAEIVCITQDQTFVLLDAVTLQQRRQIVGHNDDILSVRFVPPPLDAPVDAEGNAPLPTEMAVATNSEQLRLFNIDTFSARRFVGHTAIILAVDPSPDGRFVATASRDNEVRIWHVATGVCCGVCEGHTEAVGALSWPKRASAFGSGASPWLVSASKDKTLKVWDLADLLKAWSRDADAAAKAEPFKPRTICAVKAHDKDINYVTVAPHDRLIASAGQDKLVKLWNAEDASPAGVLRGHRRGVWACEFSTVDQVIATASADRTIRLWSVRTHTCLKTLEGHSASVLTVQFIRAGMQLLTTGADGLLKLWTIKEGECVGTFDSHSDKVWSLAVRRRRDGSGDDVCVTGGGDSVINVWRDVTAEEDEAGVVAAEAAMLQQQDLMNAMAMRDYRRALELTVELEQPFRLRAILEEMLEMGPKSLKEAMADSFAVDVEGELRDMAAAREGHSSLSERATLGAPDSASSGAAAAQGKGREMIVRWLRSLNEEKMARVISYCRDWNTSARNCAVAHAILSLALRSVPHSRLASVPGGRSLLAGIVPYSERHFERVDRLMQGAYAVDDILATMSRLVPIVADADSGGGSAGAEPAPAPAAPIAAVAEGTVSGAEDSDGSDSGNESDSISENSKSSSSSPSDNSEGSGSSEDESGGAAATRRPRRAAAAAAEAKLATQTAPRRSRRGSVSESVPTTTPRRASRAPSRPATAKASKRARPTVAAKRATRSAAKAKRSRR